MSCPRCESSKINWVSEEFNGNFYYSISKCNDCETVFQDVYEYIGTDVIVEGHYEEEIVDVRSV